MLNKKITQYIVTNDCKSTEDMEIFTVVCKKEQACEYIEQRVKLDNAEHFISWCNLRNLNPGDQMSWEKYAVSCDVSFDKYVFKKVKIDERGIAAICRMCNHCLPIGCSFDEPAEYKRMISDIPEEKREELLKQINDMTLDILENMKKEDIKSK